jgi:hypothetical protein
MQGHRPLRFNRTLTLEFHSSTYRVDYPLQLQLSFFPDDDYMVYYVNFLTRHNHMSPYKRTTSSDLIVGDSEDVTHLPRIQILF